MKGTIFAVALNHRSQLDAWQEAFQQSPYKAPPKTAVWFIKPRNTVIGCGEPIPFPQGEKVQGKAGKKRRMVSSTAETAPGFKKGGFFATDCAFLI